MNKYTDNLVCNVNFDEEHKGFWIYYTYIMEVMTLFNYGFSLYYEDVYTIGNNLYFNWGMDNMVYATIFDIESSQNYIIRFESSTFREYNISKLSKLQFCIIEEKLVTVFKTNQTKCIWEQYY